MAHSRHFRFGIDLQHAFEGRSWLDTVREAEGMGYSTVFVPDHFDEGLGPITALATAAAATSTINSDHWCSTATSAIRRCWPASWRASTSCPAAGWRWGSEPAGSASTTSGRASRWTARKFASSA